MRKSFTWFLSLMVLLTAFATHGYAQEAQETVELYAEDASYCYDEANDYTVTISVRDFIQLSEFELNLEFNDAIFAFDAESNVHPSLSGVSVSESGGIISIDWSGSATTIGDNVKTDILDLHFTVLSYPNNIAPSFSSDMMWGATNFWYDIPDGEDLVNTDTSNDGSLAVNVGLSDITTQMTAESCFGGNVTVTVTAPAEAVEYLFNEDPNPENWVWTNSPSFESAAGGVVTVRVKDANGCMSLKHTVNIPESVDPVAFTVETHNPVCYGEDGSVIISATGGTAPYTYYIAPDADGGPDMGDITTKSNFQFAWEPGVYWVNVQDANDCAELDWVQIEIIDENVELIAAATHTDASCNNYDDGTITASAMGGTGAGYMYSIDGINWQATGDFDELMAGTYTVWVKDDNGCMDDTVGVIVGQPEAITFDMAVEDVTCGGDNDGEIAVTNIVGGTAPYTLAIEEDGNVTTETGVASAYTFTGLMPTYYSLTITDANGCSVEYYNPNLSGNVIAVQSPEDIQFQVDITDPLCNDEAAMVTVTNITGGSGNYTILFNGVESEEVSANMYVWPYPYDGLTVTVQNEEGDICPVSQNFDYMDVVNPDALSAWVTDEFAPTCIEGNDGNIHLMIEGGTAPYFYSINGSSWKETDDNLTIIKVGVGTHEIVVKDANDCVYDSEIEVTISMEENVIWAESDEHIECFGDKAGTISVYFTSWADGLTDGEPNRGIQFYVENEAGQISSFGPSNIVGSPTTFNAGTYVIWVVDQYTCESNTDTIEITENPELLITDVNANGASCFGTYEGIITVQATGGNVDGLLEYAIVNNEGALGNIGENLWLDFETYDPETTLSTVSFNVDGGTFWIAVRDNGCDEVYYGPVEVDGYDPLLVDEDDITWTHPLCYEAEDGTITVPMSAVTGGAGAYLFTLLDGEGDPVEGYEDQATGLFTGLPEGVYAVLVEDVVGCPSYTTEDIMLDDPDLLSFTTSIKHMRCEDTNDGKITVNVSGGTPDFWYAINNPNSWIAFAEGATSKTYIATEPGTFNVWVKDANGCMAGPTEVTILEPEALDAEVTVTQNVSCNGGSDGAISVVGSGGWEGMSYYGFKVNDGSWTSATTFSGLPAGDHTLYIMDYYSYSGDYQQLDCEYSVPFTIIEPDSIKYTVEITDVKCKDGADGTFTVEIIDGGTAFVDEEGDDDGFLIRLTGSGYDSGMLYTGDDNTYTFTGLAHSHYTVYIEDANGCTLATTTGDNKNPYTTVESWEVQEPDTYLTFEAEWIQDATCFDEEDGQFLVHAMGGTAPYKYYAGLSIPPNGGGHLLVEAPAEDSEEWQTSNEFNVGAGTWVVWVMDANGCIVGGEEDEFGTPVNEWRVQIEQPDEIMWQFHMIKGEVHYVMPKCYGSWDGSIHLVNITGGSGVYNARVWGTSAAGESVDSTYTDIEADGPIYWLNGVPASNDDGFEVTVTDANGCTSAIDTIYVDQPEELMVDLVKAEGSFTCAGAVEGLIEANVSGGTGDYEYQLWKNGVIHTPWQSEGSAFLVEIGNIFVVEVRDENDCVSSDTIAIDPVQEVLIASVEDRSCFGEDSPTALITATAEEGRMLYVRYRKVEGASSVGPWSSWVAFNEAEGVGTHKMDTGLTYGDDNESDGHYRFQVKDQMECISDSVLKTFVPVQTELMISTVVEGNEITVNAAGGAVDSEQNHHYQYALGTEEGGEELAWQNENIFVTDSFNVYVVFVRDYHWCWKSDTVEAGYDAKTIAEVQGDGDVSPEDGNTVGVTGTVTGIVEGTGFFMQDGNGAWNGIWVAYADAASMAVGDGVSVVGVVSEVDDVTTITASVVEAADAVAITAEEVDVPSDAQNEMYESVLVKVSGARAAEVNENGEWEIYYEMTDSVIVNDLMFAYTPTVDHYFDVTGVVNGGMNAFTMEPRMESDIVDITATTGLDPEAQAIDFQVYPNPFDSHITIKNNDKLTRVVISNIAGQRVLDIEYPDREIRTANLKTGVYVVSLFTNDGLAKTERIVKWR
ncbi:T9SS C-terminal target domain-containing protein [Mariniphaga sediminis]|uniref:T9SS C-terminal target domain-containing protein n=1 Tax=Mariniphaga sediminis TaxID=1628158 RepID=A0A399D3G2_9BACT|nr:T9SS type A sorting domain-containing protein [Mariniphaga sediminis]RIH66097.1 T9SS C-terminal target domain-containing protein [Mariniphaga sediminis]